MLFGQVYDEAFDQVLTRCMSRTPAGSDGDEFMAGRTFPLSVVHPYHILLLKYHQLPGTCQSVLYIPAAMYPVEIAVVCYELG